MLNRVEDSPPAARRGAYPLTKILILAGVLSCRQTRIKNRSCLNMASKTPPRAPKMPPRASKMLPRASKSLQEPPRASKSFRDASKMLPRRLQDLQVGFKTLQPDPPILKKPLNANCFSVCFAKSTKSFQVARTPTWPQNLSSWLHNPSKLVPRPLKLAPRPPKLAPNLSG